MHPRDVKYTHDCTQSHSNRVSLKENLRETIEIWWAFPVDIFPLEPMHFVFTTRKGLPIWSMYGIYANIWGIFMVNVTIYSIHGSYGLWIPFFFGEVLWVYWPCSWSCPATNWMSSHLFGTVPQNFGRKHTSVYWQNHCFSQVFSKFECRRKIGKPHGIQGSDPHL